MAPEATETVVATDAGQVGFEYTRVTAVKTAVRRSSRIARS